MRNHRIKIRPTKSGASHSSIFRIQAASKLTRHCLSAWMKMIELGGPVKLRLVS